MSLTEQIVYVVPVETARVARAAFPKGNPYLEVADKLGSIYQDREFLKLFPRNGQPAYSPVRLALATLLQFAENLSDRQAADAVRGRIDWKYVLGLELTDAGFDFSLLSEFRSRLMAGGAEQLLFDRLLKHVCELGLLTGGGRQRTDSTYVLGAIRGINRLECVGETLRAALNVLATAAPEWLLAHSQAEWVKRYGRRVEDHQLPKSEAKRQEMASLYGRDGSQLLDAIYECDAPEWLRSLPAVDLLRRVWIQQYIVSEGNLRWRTNQEIPPASLFISSPYDPEAHYAKKYTTTWIGYKVHLTEVCEPDQPHFITHVETTPAPMADGDITPAIHQALKEKQLLPKTHLVDTGYLDAQLLVTTPQDFGVDLLGPTRADYHWQAQSGQGFDAAQFQIDWKTKKALCPQGKTSLSWSPMADKHHSSVVRIKFSITDCAVCPTRTDCTKSLTRRTLTIRPEPHYQALQAARLRESTPAFKQQYALRAGVEGTISQGVRVFGLRRSRYRGLQKTHFQHLLTAAALNLIRLAHWLAGVPHAKTQRSAFVRLMAPATP